MTVRVTHRSIQEQTMAQLQGNLSAMAKLQEQVSSGKRITKPSDDPTGTVSSLALRQQLRLNDQYDRSAQDGLSWLSVQDTALQTTSSQLRAARTLVVQALNSGANTDQSRAAMALEIDGIAQTVKAMANTQYSGRNVFAGTSGAGDAVQELTPGAYTFAPTSSTVDRQVDTSSAVPVDTDGRAVFGQDSGDGQSVFSLLAQISDKLRSGSTEGLDDMLTSLDGHIGHVLEGLASVGARTNRIEQAQSVAAQARTTLTAQLSDVEDTDVPTAIINLQLQSTAYQAALTASSKVLQTSLMDFLR